MSGTVAKPAITKVIEKPTTIEELESELSRVREVGQQLRRLQATQSRRRLARAEART